jgi:hypothetical protein
MTGHTASQKRRDLQTFASTSAGIRYRFSMHSQPHSQVGGSQTAGFGSISALIATISPPFAVRFTNAT